MEEMFMVNTFPGHRVFTHKKFKAFFIEFGPIVARTIYAMLLQKKTTLITKSSGTLAGIVITRRDIVPRLRRKTRLFICLPLLHGITPPCQPAPLRTPVDPLLRNYYRPFRPPGA